ncbi:MAG: hypothetical protein NC397_05415 [Clostridium sp.]|nr:hypothetical protein [Clostridium sp.]
MDKHEYIKRVSKGLTNVSDKARLEQELMDHLSINEEFYNEIGYSSDVAEEKAVGCMGDSEILSEQIAMVHNKRNVKIYKGILFFVTLIILLCIVLNIRLNGAGYINDYFYVACALLSLLIINLYSFFARKRKSIIYAVAVIISSLISIKSVFSLDTYSVILQTNSSYIHLFRLFYIVLLLPAVVNCVLAIVFYVKTVKLKFSKKDIKTDSRLQTLTYLVILGLCIAASVMAVLTVSKLTAEIENRKSDYNQACATAYDMCSESFFNDKDAYKILDEYHLEYSSLDRYPDDIIYSDDIMLDWDNVFFTIDEYIPYYDEGSDVYPRFSVENKPIFISFNDYYEGLDLYEKNSYHIDFSDVVYSYLEDCRTNYANAASEEELGKMIADIEKNTNSKYVGDFASKGDSFKFSLKNGCELYIYDLPFESCVFVINGLEYCEYCFSDSKKISDYLFSTDDVSVYYQYYGVADEDYYGIVDDGVDEENYDIDDNKDEDCVYARYCICVVNNSNFDLENIMLKCYQMGDTEPFETELSLGDMSIFTLEKNSMVSDNTYLVSIKLNENTEEDIYELLKQKHNDIVSFSVYGKQYDIEGEWSDLS